MSKIIILIEPVDGHFNPFVPIIKKLIEREHEIICITGQSFKQRVEKMGAIFHPLPNKWDPKDAEVYDFFPELKNKKGLSQIKYYLKHIMFDQVPDVLELLQQELKVFPADVIMSDTFMVAGNWITELGGPPSVRLSILPLSLPAKNIAPFGLGLLPGNTLLLKLRNNLLKKLFEKLLFKDVQKHVNEIRTKLGLTLFDQSFFSKGFDIPNLVLHISTPSFEYVREEMPDNLKFIGPVLIDPIANFKEPNWWADINSDIPVILLNQGTVSKNLDDLINPVIEALKNAAVKVIIVPVEPGQLNNLPANMYAEKFIPFGNLLPHIDIMISNGGFGAVQNALAHGVPLIIAGATEEKMEVAARVENAGAGINLRKQNPSVSEIKMAVDKLLHNPSFKDKAKRLQTDFAKYDAAKLAVESIEQLITETNNKA